MQTEGRTEERYAPQARFIGKRGQEMLFAGSAAVVGLGALGSVSAELLARAGLGKLILIDHDIVELSNLQRQMLYDETDLNKTKASVAEVKLKKINSDVGIVSYAEHLNEKNIAEILKGADVVLDCTDNFETRFLIDEYCGRNRIRWIHAAAAGSVGNILPIMGDYCLRCVFTEGSGLNCDDMGILNTASAMVAALQVTEAIKVLIGKKPINGLIRTDVWNNKYDVLKVERKKSCVCAAGTETKMGKNQTGFTVGKCKTRAACSAKPLGRVKLNLAKIKKEFEVLVDTPVALVVKEEGIEIIVHSYGELIFKSFYDEEKIKKIAEKIYRVGK